jgi:carbamoyltransferase
LYRKDDGVIKIKILGITDAKDSGACLLDDGEILCAINEERLSRVKLESEFPWRSIEKIFEVTKTLPEEIDKIVVAGIVSPFFLTRLIKRFKSMEDEVLEKHEKSLKTSLSDFIKFGIKLSLIKPNATIKNLNKIVLTRIVRRELPKELRKKPIEFIDHHLAHAAGAYFTSGKKKVLCVTADGYGDGVSLTVNKCENRDIERLYEVDAYDSFGLFYSMVTGFLGFKQHSDEGKITGLAAYGKPNKIKLDFPFEVINGKIRYMQKFGFSGREWLKEEFKNQRREDIAAWLQYNTERFICKIVEEWCKKTKIYDIALAGGLFANVKINQKIHEMPNVSSVYIFPHMGDGGLAVGVGLSIIKPKPIKLKNIYFGPSYSKEEIISELENSGLKYTYNKEIEFQIAKLLSKGKIVARFKGGMEFGPRALGNRSILAPATDPSIVNLLNKKLKRTDFMPFAPATLAKYGEKCYKNIFGAKYAAKFMTISFECTNWMKKCCPAVVHVDGTARPQLIDKKMNPSFYKIVYEYMKITGMPSLLNTSFNMHGEPIVESSRDAIETFMKAKLDYLAIENYLVRRQ